MPGLFGYFGNNKKEALASSMKTLLMHGENWFDSTQINHRYGFHGTSDFKQSLENKSYCSNDKSVIIYGNIYSYRDKKLERNLSKKIFSLYEKYNLNFLKDLNGSFILSICDNETLFLITDRLGSKNLYYSIESDNIFYSSEIKAILANKSIKPKLNYKAIAEFFTFTFLLRNNSFFRGIKLVPPGSILVFRRNKNLIEKYWEIRFNKDEHKNPNLRELLKEFSLIMERAIENRIADKDKIAIFLSGGLDSRLLAGFTKKIVEKTGKRLISFTFGTKGGWQEKIARRVAKKLKIENKFFEIPTDFIARYAKEIVYKSDGHIRIRDAHFISLLKEVRSEVDTVLLGFFCSELFGELLSPRIFNCASKEELINFLFNQYKINYPINKIFSTNFPINIKETAEEDFLLTIKEIPFDDYDEIWDFWEIKQRDRRYIIPLSNYINWYLETRLPFLDNKVIDFALNLHVDLRYRKNFIHKANRYIFPNLADIPWEKSGVPPGYTGLLKKIIEFKRGEINNFRYRLNKFTHGIIKLRTPDYRAYDYFLRTGSKNYSEYLLQQKLVNKLFNPDYVKKIIREHMIGKKNNNILICDLINFELLYKLFF